MELRQLRYLVAIAEQQHLGRAARGLYLSQPALSYALKELETELGVKLFDRHAGGMRVTAAGEDVVAEARETLRQAERVVEAANRHLRAAAGVLRVGFEASGAGELTTRSRAAFSRRHPAVRVEPKRFEWGEEAAALRDGRADVAFVWLPNDVTGLVTEVVHTEPRVVGLPAGHRLLAGGAVPQGLSLLDVNDEPLMWTERAPREWVDWWAVNPRPDGSEPRWGPTNDNVEEMLEQVAEGVAVCFAPQSMARYYARPDIVWLPLTDAEPLRVALAWPEGADSPLVRAFAEVVRQVRESLANPGDHRPADDGPSEALRLSDAARILAGMDADEFWRLIDEARAECDPQDADGEKIAANAVDLLARLPAEEILDAHRLLEDRLAGSYVAPLWAAGYVANGGCSDDLFEYFRGWLLTRGREVFERAPADPDSLADVPSVRAAAESGWDLECETALGITRDAYEQATGGPMPDGVWQGSYPDLGGEYWFDYSDSARLARLLPRLTALYADEA